MKKRFSFLLLIFLFQLFYFKVHADSPRNDDINMPSILLSIPTNYQTIYFHDELILKNICGKREFTGKRRFSIGFGEPSDSSIFPIEMDIISSAGETQKISFEEFLGEIQQEIDNNSDFISYSSESEVPTLNVYIYIRNSEGEVRCLSQEPVLGMLDRLLARDYHGNYAPNYPMGQTTCSRFHTAQSNATLAAIGLSGLISTVTSPLAVTAPSFLTTIVSTFTAAVISSAATAGALAVPMAFVATLAFIATCYINS